MQGEFKQTLKGTKFYLDGECVCYKCHKKIKENDPVKWCDDCFKGVLEEIRTLREKGVSLVIIGRTVSMSANFVQKFLGEKKKKWNEYIKDRTEKKDDIEIREETEEDKLTWYKWALQRKLDREKKDPVAFLKSKIR